MCIKGYGLLLLAGLTGLCGAEEKPNVLLILADDLRNQLGCYGDDVVKSPEIDRFAETAMRFDRAYVQCAICSPSRNSFLSGLRPGTTGLRGFGKTIRQAVPDVVTLPQHFKNHGYHSAAFGKVFHVYVETGLGSEDDPESWSQPLIMPEGPIWGPEQGAARARRIEADRAAGKVYKHSHDWPRGEAFDDPEVADDALRDGQTVKHFARFLRERAEKPGQPFFAAVGFFLPHLPYVAPKSYFDLYEAAEVPLPEDTEPPVGAPAWALNAGMVSHYVNFPAPQDRDDAFKKRYLEAYLASISYVDACFGRVMSALEEVGLAEGTIVIFASDHGYLMGEHGSWGHKHCNYEMAVRAPLLVRAPGFEAGSTAALVEFVDLYATLAELAGLPEPGRHDGLSFVPLLREPGMAWKEGAFSEMLRKGNRLGRAVRSDRYRYVEWKDRSGRLVATELYDHASDPGENRNLAGMQGLEEVEKKHAGLLAEGWRSALPKGMSHE